MHSSACFPNQPDPVLFECCCGSNPYNLGPLGNFQETFDAHGKLWWLTWMMPTRRQKKGLGYKLPKRTRAEALASAGSV